VNRVTTTGRRVVRAGIVAGAALALTATGMLAAPAGAHPGHDKGPHADDCAGRVPVGKVSFQLYSYAGWQEQIGTEGVLAELADIGYRNVEPFGASYEGRTAEEFRALLKQYRIRAQSSHGSVDEATFAEQLEFSRTVGQRYVGSGGWPAPGIAIDESSTFEDVLATAEAMNRLGERSVRAGTGKLFGHNHWWEFRTHVTNPATGETTTAWEALVEHTDPRFVAFQLDVFWATDGGADVVDLLERYGDRIDLLHIKDGDLSGDAYGFPRLAGMSDVGEGDIDWEPILEAAKGRIKLYVIERDGAPATAEFARDSFRFLTCSD
jgi:sugar phosphate isomerase/epimerase